MKIGQLAHETGVSVQTIRLYEQKGLIAAPTRLESGYREYPAAALDDVRAVKHGQRLGFTLAEMKEFIDLQQSPDKSHPALADFIAQKRAQLDERIGQLVELRDALESLSVEGYDWNAAGDCPLTRLLAGLHQKHGAVEVQP